MSDSENEMMFASIAEYLQWKAEQNPEEFPRCDPAKHPRKAYDQAELEALVKVGLEKSTTRKVPEDLQTCIAQFAMYETRKSKAIGCRNVVYKDRTYFHYPGKAQFLMSIHEDRPGPVAHSRALIDFDGLFDGDAICTSRNMTWYSPHKLCLL